MIKKFSKALMKEWSVDRKIILDFYADWCNPCQVIKPIMEQADIDEKDITFGFINVDDYDKDFLKKEFGVIAIPNIQFWSEGKKIDFVAGATSKEDVLGKIEKFSNR